MQTLRSLEDKLEDLRRDTRFCFNNYDYHHKNNEYEIMENLQDILKESLKDGEEFLNRMKSVRSSITTARKTCSELDDLLLKVGVNPDTSNTTAAISATGNCHTGSHSFSESGNTDEVLEENKENDY